MMKCGSETWRSERPKLLLPAADLGEVRYTQKNRSTVETGWWPAKAGRPEKEEKCGLAVLLEEQVQISISGEKEM